MSSMSTAVSDLDYYAQFNPEPPEDEDPFVLLDDSEDPFEIPLFATQSMMTKRGIAEWLDAVPEDDALVGIDDGGLCLRAAGSDDYYLEVGGLPEEATHVDVC